MVKKLLKSFRYGQRGFTLIELLIVVAILGLLAVAVIPNVSKFMGAGSKSACQAEAQTLQVAVDAMMAEAGVSEITAVSGWGGGEAVSVTVGTVTYYAKDYIGRTVKGTYDVAADGKVCVASYPGLDEEQIAEINAKLGCTS